MYAVLFCLIVSSLSSFFSTFFLIFFNRAYMNRQLFR